MYVWKCKLILLTDTLQQKMEITDLKKNPDENSSVLRIMATTVYKCMLFKFSQVHFDVSDWLVCFVRKLHEFNSAKELNSISLCCFSLESMWDHIFGICSHRPFCACLVIQPKTVSRFNFFSQLIDTAMKLRLKTLSWTFLFKGPSADHIISCLTRDGYDTHRFLQQLMMVLSLLEKVPSPEPSELDFYSQFGNKSTGLTTYIVNVQYITHA